MYYKYYGVIVNYHALAQVNQVTSVKSSMFSLLDPYYLFIFADILIIGGILIRRRIKLGVTERPGKIPLDRKSTRRVASVILMISLVICMLNIYPNRASMSEITQAEQMGILGYEAYTILADRPENPFRWMRLIRIALIRSNKRQRWSLSWIQGQPKAGM